MAEYNDIFRPETLAKLNAKSAESARILLGNRDLMRVMMSSQSLLNRIIRAEAPYKSRLENLAVSMITEMYPTITQENINIDAKIVSMSDVGRSLDEATPNEKRRRVINAITQGASVKSLEELFRVFKGHIDEINPALYDQYNQIMGEVFGIYDNDDAIAMMLAAVASGNKMAGGSSKIVISEALGIRARAICFPMLVHELIKGYYSILGQKGLKGDRETKQATIKKVDLLKNEPSDIRYGKFIYSAINNIFLAFADTDDKRVQSFFFQDIYDLEDDEFFPFIENAINEELTPQQIDWVQTTIENIISDLRADDFDATGINENKKLTNIYNKKKMNQQFLRMQQLAGVKSQPAFDDLVIEALTEYHLYVNYYSKGILKENLNEGIFTDLRNKLAKTFKGIKPTDALATTLFAKLRNLVKDDKLFDKIVNYLTTSKTLPSKENFSSWLDKNVPLKEVKTPMWKRAVLILMASLIGVLSAKKYDNNQINTLADNSKKIETATQQTPGLDSDEDTGDYSELAQELGVSDSTQDAIDTATGGTGDNPVDSSEDGKNIEVGFEKGEYTLNDEDKTAEEIADRIADLVPDGEQVTDGEIDVTGKISNTPGDPNSDNTAKDGSKNLDQKRIDTSKDLIPKVKDILKKKYSDKFPDPNKIKIGKEIKLKGEKVGKEGDKKEQTSGFKVNKLKTEKPKAPEKKDTPTPDVDKALFRAPKLTAPDANKYTVLAAQILPELISDEAYKNFRDNLKLGDGEVINDNSVAKNIERLKQENTKEAKDAIAALLWLRTIKKSPQTLASEFKKLDPKINLVFQGGKALKPGEKGKALYRPGSGLAQTPDAVKDQTTQLAEIYSSLLLEAQSNFSSLPGYIGDNEAKSKLGYLVPIYVYNWNATFGDGTFDYIQQGEYASSFNKFSKDAPVIVQKLSTQYGPKSQNQPSSAKKIPSDVARIIQTINKDTQLKSYLGRIDRKEELADLLLALFLYKDSKGAKLFDPNQTFAPNADKVRAALFGLNNKIKTTIKEEDNRTPEQKQIDVKKAYERIDKNTTLKNLLNKINTLDEFHQLVLQGILPFINPIFKKNTDTLKSAIAMAANSSKAYKDLFTSSNKK